MKMTLKTAIEWAETFTEGATFHAGSAGWKTVMARLLEEVKGRKTVAEMAKAICTEQLREDDNNGEM